MNNWDVRVPVKIKIPEKEETIYVSGRISLERKVWSILSDLSIEFTDPDSSANVISKFSDIYPITRCDILRGLNIHKKIKTTKNRAKYYVKKLLKRITPVTTVSTIVQLVNDEVNDGSVGRAVLDNLKIKQQTLKQDLLRAEVRTIVNRIRMSTAFTNISLQKLREVVTKEANKSKIENKAELIERVMQVCRVDVERFEEEATKLETQFNM